MARPDQKRLDDIREMCDVIGEIVERGRSRFDEDRVIQLALERALEVLGEAANSLSELAFKPRPGC